MPPELTYYTLDDDYLPKHVEIYRQTPKTGSRVTIIDRAFMSDIDATELVLQGWRVEATLPNGWKRIGPPRRPWNGE